MTTAYCYNFVIVIAAMHKSLKSFSYFIIITLSHKLRLITHLIITSNDDGTGDNNLYTPD